MASNYVNSGTPRPRLRSSSSFGSCKERSAFETLHHMMGFPKNRAEKALAATGNKGIQAASEWLLNHINDPLLDDPQPREYIVYLCPDGELLLQLKDLWEKSLQACGWNSAHIYQPHVTLGSFFTMPDEKVGVIDSVMKAMSQELDSWQDLGAIGLDLFTQNNNFIGYFITNPHHQYIEQLIIRAQQEFLKHGVEMKATLKQLHMTLAFQYDPAHHEKLMQLARQVNPKTDCSWELRVYSRDASIKNMEVRKVLQAYAAEEVDELDLVLGDYLAMEPEEHDKSPDGWFHGYSHITGRTAFFPGNFTRKCSQMEIWTLHRCLSLSTKESENKQTDSGQIVYDKLWDQSSSDKSQLKETVNNVCESDKQDLYATVSRKKKKKAPKPPRQLMIFRHAERCDFIFKDIWFKKSFNSSGEYSRINLNCPEAVFTRKSFMEYQHDTPLTVIGLTQATITGQALKEVQASVSYVYVSPALRCVQTAQRILQGLECSHKMRIEPALFEWCGWYRRGLPKFMSPSDFIKNGFPVDETYNPYIKAENINAQETVCDFYNRSHEVVKHLLRVHQQQGGNVLIVAHSGSLDSCTRQLTDRPPLVSNEDFLQKVRSAPYCSMSLAVEDPATGQWELQKPLIPSLTHGGNKDTDWTVFRK